MCGLQVPEKSLLNTYGCGLVIATPIGSCFVYQELIKPQTRLKFGVRFPSNWISITNHMCVSMGVV